MYSNWYVIQVLSNNEYRLCSKINNRIDRSLYAECFVPQAEYVYKSNGNVHTRVRPLFPGYIFVITDTVEDFYNRLRLIDGFKRFLKDGNFFTSITNEEAAFIAGVTDNEHSASMSEGYILDSKVYITSGPLMGKEGAIKKIDRHKRIALIEFSFMGNPVQIRMPLEIVSKL